MQSHLSEHSQSHFTRSQSPLLQDSAGINKWSRRKKKSLLLPRSISRSSYGQWSLFSRAQHFWSRFERIRTRALESLFFGVETLPWFQKRIGQLMIAHLKERNTNNNSRIARATKPPLSEAENQATSVVEVAPHPMHYERYLRPGVLYMLHLKLNQCCHSRKVKQKS